MRKVLLFGVVVVLCIHWLGQQHLELIMSIENIKSHIAAKKSEQAVSDLVDTLTRQLNNMTDDTALSHLILAFQRSDLAQLIVEASAIYTKANPYVDLRMQQGKEMLGWINDKHEAQVSEIRISNRQLPIIDDTSEILASCNKLCENNQSVAAKALCNQWFIAIHPTLAQARLAMILEAAKQTFVDDSENKFASYIASYKGFLPFI